jgi:pimeloyl-ACP methyl ester carboxylesterase
LVYTNILSKNDCEIYHQKIMKNHWLDKQEYPFQSHYYEINGHKLHYIDEGQGPIILFVHGTPSWSFDYRIIIKNLSHNFRCIAIDHIGFGLSDKPEFYNYSTQNHSITLEKFVMDLNLSDFTLVLHDFGGPIALNLASRHPKLVKSIIILNSWFWSSKNDADFIKFIKILKSPVIPILYKYFNFSPKYILPKSFGQKKLDPKILKQFTKPFTKISERKGPLAFVNSLLNDQDWFDQLWENKKTIAEKPVLFIWGLADLVITPRYLYKFCSGFTNHQTVLLDKVGHFPQEEDPETVIKAIREFLIKIQLVNEQRI